MNKEAKVLLGLGLLTIVLVVFGALLLGNPSTPSGKSEKADQKLLIKNNSNKIATSSAKVTLVEFGDFQCPACGAAHPIVKQILEQDKGKINFVFRHFPLTTVHKNAEIASETAEAAGEQGKFWEMYDKLYQNQTTWSEENNPLDIFIGYAKDLKLKTDDFKKAIENNKFAKKIQDDQSDGIALGVNSTPTFFINGVKVADGYADLKNKVEQEIIK